MKVAKWLFWGFIVLVIILAGGFIYETISSHLTIRARNATIDEYIADNKRLSDGLGDAEARVVDLEESLGKAERTGEELGRELEESQAGTAELKSVNQRLEGENTRLGEALSSSGAASESISEHSGLLGESIDRAIAITERYSENP